MKNKIAWMQQFIIKKFSKKSNKKILSLALLIALLVSQSLVAARAEEVTTVDGIATEEPNIASVPFATVLKIIPSSFHSSVYSIPKVIHWSEAVAVPIQQSFQLRQNLLAPFNFKKGTKFIYKSFLSLDEIEVAIFEFLKEGCVSDPAATPTDIEIVLAEGVSVGHEVGVLLEKKCVLSVFVEWKDLSTESLFNH